MVAVTFKLPHDLAASLRDLARDAGTTPSSFCRQAVTDALERKLGSEASTCIQPTEGADHGECNHS
jgi:predicted transcriptional regulator